MQLLTARRVATGCAGGASGHSTIADGLMADNIPTARKSRWYPATISAVVRAIMLDNGIDVEPPSLILIKWSPRRLPSAPLLGQHRLVHLPRRKLRVLSGPGPQTAHDRSPLLDAAKMRSPL